MSFNPCRVYVGRLPFDVRPSDVERLFDRYGRIVDIDLKNGYGFVEFRDPRDAEDACRDNDGRDFMGSRLIVEPTKGDRRGRAAGGSRFEPPMRSRYRVVVENLARGLSWQDLKDFVRSVAPVGFADAHNPRTGEGVVEFPTREDMDYALRKLDGRELGGEIIRMFEEPGAAAGAGPAAAPPPRREFRRRSYSPGPARSRSPGPRERMPYRRDDSPRDHHRPHYGRRDDSPPPRERYGRRDDSPPPPPREDGPLPPVGPRGDESPRGRDAGYDRRDDSPLRRGDSLPPRSSSPRDHRESSWDNQPPPGDAAPGVIESEGASSDH